MSDASESNPCCSQQAGFTYASLLLRLWLAVRAIQTGIEKFSGTRMTAGEAVKVDGVPNEEGLSAVSSVKFYALENYHGIPKGLLEKFNTEPLVLKALLPLYDKILGPAFLILGICILLGLFYRTSLFLIGLLYISLTWGLILLKQDDGVSWLGIHMILVVMALALASHNRFAIMKKG